MKKVAPPEVWKKLMVLGEKEGSIRLTDLAQEMCLAPEETLGYLRQIFPIGTGVECYHKDDETWIDIKGDSIQYMLPLSPAEWIQLHQLLSSEAFSKNPVTNSLRKKVTENGPIKVMMELLNQLEVWDQELSGLQQEMISQVETAIHDQQLVTLTTKEDKHYTVFPNKVLHLEGQLVLIAEDYQDHCVIVIPVQDLIGFETVPSSSHPRMTVFEVEEFITAIRAMNDKETRLILKIHDPESTNLFPDHHFLGKPCMITNPNGDLIWAAYVEPCEALYEWLMTLGNKVEILDPIKFKAEYLMYCEEKLRKVA